MNDTDQHTPPNAMRILAVDDEVMILETYLRTLSTSGTKAVTQELDNLESRLFGSKSKGRHDYNYIITTCRQGEEAIEAVKRAGEDKLPYALCFLDVRMPPGIDGIQTAEAIRKLDSNVNIVIVTAFSDYNPREIELRIPPPDKLLYLQKPFHPWEVWQVAASLTTKWTLERDLREAKQDLEKKVFDRTRELERTNDALEVDLTKRITAEKRILDYQKQLKMLASELVMAEEKERRRLAENLHDSVGHSLTAIQMKLALIMDQITDKDLLEKCECLMNMTEEAADATRVITFEISPPVLHELGFESAIEWFLERISQRFNIKTQLTMEPGRAFVDADIEVFAFRAVQELVVNAVKHANPSTITVSKQHGPGNVTLTVTDDGKGFDTEQLWKTGSELKGYGLFSIKERVNHFDGKINIESHEGEGTKVVLTLSTEGE